MNDINEALAGTMGSEAGLVLHEEEREGVCVWGGGGGCIHDDINED